MVACEQLSIGPIGRSSPFPGSHTPIISDDHHHTEAARMCHIPPKPGKKGGRSFVIIPNVDHPPDNCSAHGDHRHLNSAPCRVLRCALTIARGVSSAISTVESEVRRTVFSKIPAISIRTHLQWKKYMLRAPQAVSALGDTVTFQKCWPHFEVLAYTWKDTKRRLHKEVY